MNVKTSCILKEMGKKTVSDAGWVLATLVKIVRWVVYAIPRFFLWLPTLPAKVKLAIMNEMEGIRRSIGIVAVCAMIIAPFAIWSVIFWFYQLNPLNMSDETGNPYIGNGLIFGTVTWIILGYLLIRYISASETCEERFKGVT